MVWYGMAWYRILYKIYSLQNLWQRVKNPGGLIDLSDHSNLLTAKSDLAASRTIQYTRFSPPDSELDSSPSIRRKPPRNPLERTDIWNTSRLERKWIPSGRVIRRFECRINFFSFRHLARNKGGIIIIISVIHTYYSSSNAAEFPNHFPYFQLFFRWIQGLKN